MRILCLHGRDQNGRIFQKQLGTALKMIEESEARVTFDFTDAPIKTPGPLSDGQGAYKFFDASVLAEICEAYEWLRAKLNVDGPYDGVIGFCQGATVISSYLLYNQWYNEEESPPFRFATFISGSIPLVVLKHLGVPVPTAAENVVEEADRSCRLNLGPSPSHVALARSAMFNSDDCFGLNLNKVSPVLKIKIPTVHIWGTNDPTFPISTHLAGLCDPYIRKIYTHNGSHHVPQGPAEMHQLGELVLWCINQASWPGYLEVA